MLFFEVISVPNNLTSTMHMLTIKQTYIENNVKVLKQIQYWCEIKSILLKCIAYTSSKYFQIFNKCHLLFKDCFLFIFH